MGTELLLSVGSPSLRSLSPHDDSSSGATSLARNTAQGHCEEQQSGSTQVEGHPTTITMLPDNVLLEIFNLYRKDHYTRGPVWKWHLLAHVCQTWRQLIFASPHRLDVKILCTYGTPIRKILAIWPAFPIVIWYKPSWSSVRPDDVENITFALKHHDRVCDIELDPGLKWSLQPEIFDAAVQEPFPVLKRLYIHSVYDAPALPPEFLGGSAPSLQAIYLHGVPFPALPMLLLSTSDLVKLDLHNIPLTGYILPDVLVASLATLPRLDSLSFGFRPELTLLEIHPPPVTRTVLPSLTYIHLHGASEYMEDLVSRIDGPKLNRISIEYLWLVDYQVTQLSKFIDRSAGPKLTPFRRARVGFSSSSSRFSMYLHLCQPPLDWSPHEVHISCGGSDSHALGIARLLDHFHTSLSNVVHLDIWTMLGPSQLINVELLHLFHRFSTVQALCLDRQPAGPVAVALDDIPGEQVANVLPSLDLICLVGQPASSIGNFIVARRLSGRPVIVVDTKTEFDQRLESYVGR